MPKDTFPKLVFPHGFNERDCFEAPEKGWFGPIIVELSAGTQYVVTFYDPIRLAQDITTAGTTWLAEPGLIILQEVTVTNMEAAVKQLAKDGFFDYLAPLDELHFKKQFPLLME